MSLVAGRPVETSNPGCYKQAATSMLLMCWEGGWEWARLRGVALDAV